MGQCLCPDDEIEVFHPVNLQFPSPRDTADEMLE